MVVATSPLTSIKSVIFTEFISYTLSPSWGLDGCHHISTYVNQECHLHRVHFIYFIPITGVGWLSPHLHLRQSRVSSSHSSFHIFYPHHGGWMVVATFPLTSIKSVIFTEFISYTLSPSWGLYGCRHISTYFNQECHLHRVHFIYFIPIMGVGGLSPHLHLRQSRVSSSHSSFHILYPHHAGWMVVTTSPLTSIKSVIFTEFISYTLSPSRGLGGCHHISTYVNEECHLHRVHFIYFIPITGVGWLSPHLHLRQSRVSSSQSSFHILYPHHGGWMVVTTSPLTSIKSVIFTEFISYTLSPSRGLDGCRHISTYFNQDCHLHRVHFIYFIPIMGVGWLSPHLHLLQSRVTSSQSSFHILYPHHGGWMDVATSPLTSIKSDIFTEFISYPHHGGWMVVATSPLTSIKSDIFTEFISYPHHGGWMVVATSPLTSIKIVIFTEFIHMQHVLNKCMAVNFQLPWHRLFGIVIDCH